MELSNRGFSLVELMIVVAITVLVAGFSLIGANTSGSKLKSSATLLRAKMQQAKLRAVRENVNVYVDFDLDGGGAVDSFYTLWRDLNDNTVYDAGRELLGQVVLSDGVSFGRVPSGKGGPSKSASGTNSTDIVSFSGDRVRFAPRGTASNGWAYLYMPGELTVGTYAVGCNNVGRIQLRYWHTGGGLWR